MDADLEGDLALFVDREPEMKSFRDFLDSRTATAKRILVVWGDGGTGKSSLMARMIHECSIRNVRKAVVIWTDTRSHDYVAVMRSLRDDIGTAAFNRFTDLVNYFTVAHYELKLSLDGSSYSVGQNMRLEGSSTGDIAAVIIRDSMITFPRGDMQVPESERVARLTDAFIADLAAAARDEPLVLFLDAVEKMTESTEAWVWGELLEAIRDRRLSNVICILFGRKRRELDRRWTSCADQRQLQPLGLPETLQYLEVRGVREAEREAFAKACMAFTSGGILPLQLATVVDAYLLTHPG